MSRPSDVDETASRANDRKQDHGRGANRGGRVTDGKDEDVAQGGKRRGPGRWVNPEVTTD